MSYNYLLLNGIVFCLVNVVFLIVGSFLNVVVALSIWKSTQLRKKLSYFMIFILSCYDLLEVTVLHSMAILRYILWITKGCCVHSQNFYVFFHISELIFTWSFFGLLTLTLERYLGLAYPIFHKTSVTKRRLITFLLATQTCALILDIITSNFRVSKIEQPYTIIFVSAFVILVIALNCKMFYIAKSRHNTSSNGGKKFFQFKKYHTCLLAAILFFLTCCPIFVYYGLVFLNMLDKKSDIAVCLFFWASTVVTMNSTANAVIFFWINNVLRSEGKKLVKKLCPSFCMF